MTPDNSKILNRNFLLITTLGFFFFFNFHSFLLLPPQIVKMGATESVVGFVMGIAGLSTLLLTPLVGTLADRYGKRIFISSGLLIMSLSTLPFAYLENIGLEIYILRFFHGAAFSLFFIAAGAFTADVSPENRRTQAIGIYGVFTIVNYAIAPFAGNMMINYLGFGSFIYVLFLFGFAGFFISLLLPASVNAGEKEAVNYVWHYSDYLKNRKTLIAAVCLFVMGAAFISILNFISIFSLSIGINSFSLFFVFYTLSVLVVRLLFGWVPDFYGKWTVSPPAIAVFGISVVILAFTENLYVLLFSAVLFGIGHGFSYPAIYTIIIETASSVSRSRSFAVSSLSFTTGGMIGSFLYGAIAEYLGYRWMFLIIALTVLIIFIFIEKFVWNVRSEEFMYE